MGQTNQTPNFKFSYEKLYQLSNHTVSLMERDLSEFNNYGVTQQLIDEFRNVNENFVSTSYDNELLGNQMFMTEAKNILAEEIRSGLYQIMIKVRMYASKNSVMYLQFRNDEISKITDLELASQFRKSITIIRGKIETLTDYGFSEDLLNQFEGKLNNFTEKIDAKRLAINQRDIATQERHVKANKVYDLLSKYSYVGRMMWLKTDEARSNDYILYHTASKQDEQPGDSPPEPESYGEVITNV